MKENFFYPYEPRIKVIFNKIVYGRGTRSDFEIISRSFVLEGAPILATEKKYIIDKKVYYLEKKQCYFAKKTGFVFFDNKKITILPYIWISHEKLSSFIIVPAKEFTKKLITEEIIYKDINAIGFKNSINQEVAKECISLYQRSGGFKIIYKGTKMIPDRIDDIHFDDKFNFSDENFSLLEDRRVLSPKEISFYHLVNKGDRIGFFERLIHGKDGEDIFGKKIPHTQIRSFYKIGEGLKINSNGEVISTEQGVLRINTNGKLTVKKTKIIRDDLKTDLKVKDPEDVIIMGRIQSNIKIELSGSLVVIGSIESIHIDCGGDLLLTNGINSQSIIKVKGDCLFQFIANSQLESGGEVMIGQYTLNSKVKSRKDIVVRTNLYGEIVGGSVETEIGNIETNSVGSISGTPTLLKLGIYVPQKIDESTTKDNLKKYSNEKFILEQKIHKLSPLIQSTYKRWQKNSQFFSDVEKSQFKKNILVFKQIKAQLQELEEKIMEMESSLSEKKSSKKNQNQIKIFEGVFGGVTVQIMNIKYYFKDNIYRGCILRKDPVLPKIGSSFLDI